MQQLPLGQTPKPHFTAASSSGRAGLLWCGAVQGGKEGQSPALTRPPIQGADNLRRKGPWPITPVETAPLRRCESSPASRAEKTAPAGFCHRFRRSTHQLPTGTIRPGRPRPPAPGRPYQPRRNSGSPKSVHLHANPTKHPQERARDTDTEAVLPASKPAAGGQPPAPQGQRAPNPLRLKRRPHPTAPQERLPSQPPPVKEAPQPAPGRKTVPRKRRRRIAQPAPLNQDEVVNVNDKNQGFSLAKLLDKSFVATILNGGDKRRPLWAAIAAAESFLPQLLKIAGCLLSFWWCFCRLCLFLSLVNPNFGSLRWRMPT